MSGDLRTGLWNVLHVAFWSRYDFVWGTRNQSGELQHLANRMWFHYFKKPIDAAPTHPPEIVQEIRDYFFDCSWNEVYDFLEFLVNDQHEVEKLEEYLNTILEREVSAFRFLDGQIVDITSEQELEMLQEAVADDRFGAVAAHLRRALELYSDRKSPDYRNSIKESISAVEAMARIVAENSKAILPDALKALEKNGKLHPALKEGFVKLYGYTSDESGIRHAMLEEPSIDSADARFFLLSCTSFVNYLKSQLT
jgi:hypothetical protein